MLHTRCASVCAVAALLFAFPFLRAQNSVTSRIIAPIDESRLATLSGGVSTHARAEFDLGRAPASTQMSSVRLVLSRSPQQEAALEKFMADQLDRHSPNFRKWLTPDQFGKLYGPSDSDIQTLVTWLQSRGFTVQPVPQGRVSIAFSGSVSQIEAAFHTEIHSFNAHGEEFLSNISNPSIPSALAPVISGIAQLNTIRPRPHNALGRMGTYDSQQKRLVPADRDASDPTPLLTIGNSSSGYQLFLVASDAATIYDTPNRFNNNFNVGTSYTGTGVTIGIGGDAPIQATTVAGYRSQFLGNSTQPTITTVGTAPTNTNDTDEAYIDTELSGGLAPGATINFYTAINLTDAINQAIEDNKVDIFSLSFGECEAAMTTAGNQLINNWWQQASAQGIAVTVSTGDSGSAGCDNDNTEQTAQYGLQVSGFASTPYNIAVGGTDFPILLTDFNSYVETGNGTYYGSAVSYIPESTWNGSTISNTTISSDTPYINSSSGKGNIVAGSGGVSSCSTNNNTATSSSISNCTSGYAKPTWQTGAGVPSDGVRDLPDISLFASNGVDGASWLVCTDDQFTENGVTYTTNCTAQTGGGFAFVGFGGTSTSAPAFAGILALVQSSLAGTQRLGLAAQTLYQLYNGPHTSAVFHDTTVGNISVPCTSSTPNCSKNAAGSYFLTGYNTGTGYDLATGLGSLDATQLIDYWQSPSGTQTATVTLGSSTPSTISVTDSLSVPVTVSGTSTTPTGSVRLYISSVFYPGVAYSAALALSGGTATFTVPQYSLHQGDDMIEVTYNGDATYAPAYSSNPSVTVNPITPTVTVTPSATTVNVGTSFTLAVTVNGPAGAPVPTGSVEVWADNKNILTAQTLVNGSHTFTVPANTLTVGSTPIEVDYGDASDPNYAYASGTTTVTVTASTFTLAGPSTQPSISSPGGSATSSVTISSSSGYSGSIGLTCALTTSPAGAVDSPTCALPASVSLSSSLTSVTQEITFSTTAASAVRGGSGIVSLAKSSAVTLLAFLVFLGIPARRRAWRAIVGMLVLVVAFGTLSACGGGSGGGGGANANPGTTMGTYTFTVTATPSGTGTTAQTATISLTVN